ncbi:hypothetical protein [uncultured Photobacterium sp.]|uniref:hypothetical protein n=1 Tax=uncultured Photobacterium sp. TaxID=173973 RepID=UPI0026387CAD|nr:hypothetical protein [uncultured Photobacterium sp.]
MHRDALVESTEQFEDLNEARKFLYRQILRLVEKGLLQKQPTKGRKSTIYFKSGTFKQNKFIAKSRRVKEQETSVTVSNSFLETIQKEKSELEALQEIALREMNKYQEVLNRFPDEANYVRTFFLEARERAKNIQGDLEALTRLLLNYPQSLEKASC